jgi:hypothetical protein
MDDLDLDRELQAAFAVEPSPEFVARVRMAIAETPSSSMTARLLKPAAAIACVVLVAIAVGLPREDARLELRRAEITSRAAEVAPVTAGLKPGTANIQSSTTNVRLPNVEPVVPKRTARASAISSEPPLPEVIIAADDVEAFLQFVSGARDLRFVASFDETPVSTPWVMTELSIAPIAVGAPESAPAHNN